MGSDTPAMMRMSFLDTGFFDSRYRQGQIET
jgi:hypothetical protein